MENSFLSTHSCCNNVDVSLSVRWTKGRWPKRIRWVRLTNWIMDYVSSSITEERSSIPNIVVFVPGSYGQTPNNSTESYSTNSTSGNYPDTWAKTQCKWIQPHPIVKMCKDHMWSNCFWFIVIFSAGKGTSSLVFDHSSVSYLYPRCSDMSRIEHQLDSNSSRQASQCPHW